MIGHHSSRSSGRLPVVKFEANPFANDRILSESEAFCFILPSLTTTCRDNRSLTLREKQRTK